MTMTLYAKLRNDKSWLKKTKYYVYCYHLRISAHILFRRNPIDETPHNVCKKCNTKPVSEIE